MANNPVMRKSDLDLALARIRRGQGVSSYSDLLDKPSINGTTLNGDLTLNYAGSSEPGGIANKTMSIPFGALDSTSTSTVMTAQIDGITELRDGVCMFLRNDVVTSASGFTININSLGAKPVYNSMADATRITTTFNVNYTMLFIYNSTRVSGGCWDMYYGYNSDTTTARGMNDYYFRAYAGQTIYRYKFLMQGEDNRMYPITVTNQTSATQVHKVPTTVGLRPWKIWYYNSTTTVNAGAAIGAQTMLSAIYGTTAVYNFNGNAPAYNMIYLKGTYDKAKDLFYLHNDGSDPCVSYYMWVPTNTANITLSDYFQEGYYYILLGGTYSSNNYFQLFTVNPLYYFDGSHLIAVSGDGGVTDVRVNNSSVVSGGVANIPLANGTNWGLVQVSGATEPGSSYVTITRNNGRDNYTYTVPSLNLNGTVLPSYLPDATHTQKGAVTLTRWTGSITDNIDEGSAEGYDSTVGGIARTVTTDSGDFSLTVGNRVVISGMDMWGYTTNYPHFINVDNTGYVELRYTSSEQVRSTKYEILLSGTIEVVYNGTYFIIVNGYAFKKPVPSVASSSEYGTVKVYYQYDPGIQVVRITNSQGDMYVPYIGNNSSSLMTIRPSYLPSATASEKGAVIVDSAMSDSSANPVQNSVVKAYIDSILPSVTSSDDGKVLRVVNGTWSAVALPSASGVSF